LLELAARPGIAIISLQIGATTEEQELLTEQRITHIGDRLGDYADTAAAISKLDLVISVESPEAHLAGALAHPVWLILGTAADWRWPNGGNGSPWYPTMRVFRQDQTGDWSGVARMLPEALAAGPSQSPIR
jgi:ADP-heptose:LPS heptosyltransferase